MTDTDEATEYHSEWANTGGDGTEGVKYEDRWGNRERETKAAPGIILGAGMRLPVSGRTSLEFGPRYVWTGSLGWTQHESSTTPEEPEGINEFGLSVSVTRAL